MNCRGICGIAQFLLECSTRSGSQSLAAGALLFGQDQCLPLLLREERKDLAVSEGMPENYKYTMVWHLVVICSFRSFIRRRWFWAALMWHGAGSLCLLLFCLSQAQNHWEVLQLQNQLMTCTAAFSGADPPNNLFCCLMSDQQWFSISYVGSLCLFLGVQTSQEICAGFHSICISAVSF